MNRLSLLVFIALSAVFLAMFTPLFLNPSLYTPDAKSSTFYHQNPASSQYSYKRSDDIQSMMQELLDTQLSIVLSIKIRNFKDAKREFSTYYDKSLYFNEVVFRLDLNESLIGDFRSENRENLDDIGRIINDCEQLDEINRLKIQYSAEKKPALFYSVSSNGAEIQNALIKTTTQFRDRGVNIIEISRQLNLDATRFQKVDGILKEIVDEEEKKQEEWELKPPETGLSSISLSVSPVSGRYGDTLQVTGGSAYFHRPEVTLVLDGNTWETLQPDTRGVFSTPLKIETIRAGRHAIFATDGIIYSDLVTFSVIPAQPVLTLEVYPVNQRSQIFCSGEMNAEGIPVTDAPVRILVDDFEALSVNTNETGFYEASLNPSQGNHTIKAIFDDAAFPLNRSETGVQIIEIEPSFSTLLLIFLGAGVVILAILGLIRHMGGMKVKNHKCTPRERTGGISGVEQEPAASSPSPPVPSDFLSHLNEILAAFKVGLDEEKGRNK